MNASLLVLAVCVGACIALDCRKFAFAPACRGIMLKRAEGTEEPSSEDSGEHYLATLMQVHDDLTELKTAIEKATADGKFDCKALTWLKDRMVTKKWDRQFAFA